MTATDWSPPQEDNFRLVAKPFKLTQSKNREEVFKITAV